MDNLNWKEIWEILDKIGILIGILTFVVSTLIYLWVRKQKREMKKLAAQLPPSDYHEAFERHETITSDNPMALCICLIDNTHSIKNAAESFLESTGRKMSEIEELNLNGITPDADSMSNYINKLRKLRKGKLANATEIHLFLAGPMQAAAIAGAVLDNWHPVILYNKKGTTYEYWGPLLKR